MQKQLLPIHVVAGKLGLPDRYFQSIGPHGGKIEVDLLSDPSLPRRGKLILVTGTTPTISGEGKTVTAIGLAQGLAQIGKKAVLTSREPSLGPVFGMKGGAAGGGLSQIEPSEKINLHFHGDFHAIASAQNLLAALIDAHIFHGNDLHLDPDRISWPRTMDMNDRALRQISVALDSTEGRRGTPHRICDYGRLRSHGDHGARAQSRRFAEAARFHRHWCQSRRGPGSGARPGRHRRNDGPACRSHLFPIWCRQPTERLLWCTRGRSANIATGTSSVISQEMGLRLADYVVNEVGFGSDLGAEKYFDIVMQQSGIAPAAAVLVTTVRTHQESRRRLHRSRLSQILASTSKS